jgi:hypothetical protein
MNKKITLDKLIIISIISIFCLIFFHALFVSLNVEYRPYNGDFQTFNPLRRIFTGEVPGRDFNPYLGLGVTYFNTITTYLFGGNFAASKFSTYFLSVTLHYLTLITLFFLSGLSIKKSVIAGAFPLITIYLDQEKLIPIWYVIEPSNSNLSLRSFLPFVTVIILFFLFKIFQRFPYFFYLAVGCLIGCQPFWSNDYGIPSFISLIVIITFDLIKKKQGNKLGKIIYLFVSIFIGFSLAAYIFTGGYPFNWIQDNFGGVAQDQFWYFLWFNHKTQNKIFALSNVLSHPFLWLYFILMIVIFFYLIFRDYSVKFLLLFYLAITVFGAGILSSVGGTISFRYYLTTILVFLFILPVVIILLYDSFPQYRFNFTWKFKQRLLILLLTIYYPLVSLISIVNAGDFLPNLYQDYFWVEELGGWLPIYWKKSIDIAKNIKEELSSVSSEQRMLSTYSSGMDVVAGAFNPTKVDYIIHVLGDEARDDYLRKFRETKPQYITTLREDFTDWETWVRRTNWWFYRDFFNDYEPVEATFYNIIWRRLEQSKRVNKEAVICEILPENNHRVNLKIKTENMVADDRTYYVELALNYSLSVQSTGVPLIGERGLVNAIENQTALSKWIAQPNNRKYGLPPGHENWYIPIEHILGTPSILVIESYPENRSQLVIKSCEARLIAPVNDFTFTGEFRAENINSHNYIHGISVNQLAGFIINDQQIRSELYPGMELKFAYSGRRKIIEIKDNQVIVSGSPLSPDGDGYPHAILTNLR